MEKTILEERKKTIYQFICDEFYVPMKAKEMAVVLSVPKSQRSELQEVLDALVMDGRIEVTSKGKYIKSDVLCQCFYNPNCAKKLKLFKGLSIW